MGSVFHSGEAALQAAAGSRERLAEVGTRVIRQEMPEQHRAFFAGLPFVVLAATDPGGQPHATLLAGPPGLLTATDSRHLQLASLPAPDDPLHPLLTPGARFGLLGIEPHTRRRNRANGRVQARGADGLHLEVTQSFGNCPKYIQPRRAVFDPSWKPGARAEHRLSLNEAERAWIAAADTFFIATAHPSDDADPAHGVDVSHRGGPPGFISVEGNTLGIDDFAGNNYFNTLGNLLLNPQAGLLFPDFARGGLLQLNATAEILPGPPRRLLLRVSKVTHHPAAQPLRWEEASG
ncbi:MAG: pyridoxamine 5'-phosphate oxidase family protein [Zoogloea sp.]|uniref:pyridoxamine 5'-phosphate oxidase family protein n=1 Tax=Zoogloea sp. TaxID=49181 RepID=UPI002615DB95|nr:pyridoxamine 5'-phosphate oxidase family protein [Zoogloea sp.]MDD2990894.1 pyridoxamine 5'-phosphate oxidase family protein [Zoogloea sp.]